MTFPTTGFAVLDSLDQPVGLMTSGNWRQDTSGANALRIVAGGAQATVSGVSSHALWTVRAATVLSAFVTVAVLPTAPNFAVVGAMETPDWNAQLAVSLDPASGHVNILTDLGGTPFTPGAFSNGDGIGMTYNAATDTVTGWYRAAGAAAWTNLGTAAGGRTTVPNGWYLYVGGNDASNMRLRDFGGQTLPSTNLTTPIVHGRGAC